MSIYIISPEAIQDLDEISEYFASRNLDAGDRFVNSFEEIEAIAKQTHSCTVKGKRTVKIEPTPS